METKLKKKKVIKEKKNRKGYQMLFLILLPIVVVGGYFYPYLGWIVVALIIFFSILASYKGRYYCGWFCPMGAFHERVSSYISFKKEIPSLFYKNKFRWLVFIVMMSLLTLRLIRAGSNPEKIADAFRFMWIVSTAIAILIGVFFKPRTWCRICPMATMQGVLSKNTNLLQIDEKCKECKLCQKVCPISSAPFLHKDKGFMESVECMRCYNCIENCPTNSLSFN